MFFPFLVPLFGLLPLYQTPNPSSLPFFSNFHLFNLLSPCPFAFPMLIYLPLSFSVTNLTSSRDILVIRQPFTFYQWLLDFHLTNLPSSLVDPCSNNDATVPCYLPSSILDSSIFHDESSISPPFFVIDLSSKTHSTAFSSLLGSTQADSTSLQSVCSN